eukprot:XP_014768993.1 PREDICTED: uncharacterized protein LOC106868315 isoform X2 [Octopus bimaculoides]
MASSALLTQNQLSEGHSEEHHSSNRDSVGDTRSSSCGSCDDHTMDAVSCGSDASDCLQPITMETNPIFQHSPDSGTFGSLRDADLHMAPSELQELHQRNKDALLQHEINMNLNHGLQCIDMSIDQHDMHGLEENDNLVSVARTHLDDKLSEQIGNDSSSLHTRTSSVQSFGSISSTNSAYSVSRTSYSGVSQSPSSLVPQSPDDIPPVDPHALMDLETQAKQVADRLDHMMSSLKSNLHKMSALTSGCLDAYKKSVDSTCDAVDASIKSMYALMAKCEELGKSMTPIYQLANQIKEIKRLLDIFENKLVDRS